MTTSPLRIFVRPERRFVAANKPTELIVLIRLLPNVPERAAKRVPLNLGVVLDRSRSMKGGRLDTAVSALHRLLERLEPGDRLSLITAGDVVDVAVPSTPVSSTEPFLRALEGVRCDGLAPLYPAWLMAAHEVARHHDRRQLNRVLVLSDGMTQTSDADTRRALEASRGLFRLGVSTSTFGIGDGFHEDALLPLAVEGGGTACYVRRDDDLPERLEQEANAARDIFCEWATLRLDVEGAEVLDVLNDLPTVTDQKFALPPLYGGLPLNIVVRLRLEGGTAGQEAHPLTVRIKSLDLQAKQAVVHKKSLRVHVVSDALADSMGPDLGVQAHAARLEFARMHGKVVRKLDAGDLNGAAQLLEFSLARFQALSGQSGGTLLTEDLLEMMKLREALADASRVPDHRKLFAYAASFAQRGGYASPF